MPIVNIVSNKLSEKQRKELVAGVTEVCSKVMQMPPQSIIVILDEKTPETIGVGGVLLSDRPK